MMVLDSNTQAARSYQSTYMFCSIYTANGIVKKLAIFYLCIVEASSTTSFHMGLHLNPTQRSFKIWDIF